MTQSRETQISLQDTRYYHCISRCVRRAFLCGKDEYSGQSFEHRRQWVVDRIRQLSTVFAIDVAAYAVMSNHYHLVLHVDVEDAKVWSHTEVVNRWKQIYLSRPIVDRYLDNKTDTTETLQAVEIIEKWRSRLFDISWFMKCLNEYIAVAANKEDHCKGRFWEGRFKSQALLDEKAVLTCMAYVDLNPIRAKMADSADSSEYTSIYERIHNKSSIEDNWDKNGFKFKPLFGFIGDENKENQDVKGIRISLIQYIKLVDWTGRFFREDKAGHINESEPELLKKLGFDDKNWQMLASQFGKKYHRAIGSLAELNEFAAHTNHKWCADRAELDRYFS